MLIEEEKNILVNAHLMYVHMYVCMQIKPSFCMWKFFKLPITLTLIFLNETIYI